MTIEELKSKIDATINGNGKRLITGAQLNEVLNAIATYTAEVEDVSLKVPQFLPFDSIIANADVQVGSTSATDYKIVYVESKNVFTAYTSGVYYTDWVGSSSYNKGTFSKTAISANLYINPYAEIYKIENNKLVAIQDNVLQEHVLSLLKDVVANTEDIEQNTKNIATNTANIEKKVGLMGEPTTENGIQSGTLEYKNLPLFPTTRDNKVFVQSKNRTLDTVIGDIETEIKKEATRAKAREDEIAETLAGTKEKVDTFLVDADTSEQAIDKLKELQDYIKSDETSASQMLGDIAQNKQDIAENAEALEKEAIRAKQTEMYLESQKANKSGYYENLSVGIADNLSGRGEATDSEFTMRPSGGENKSIQDGTARINSIKGNSVVYNQLVNNIVSNDLGTTGWFVRQGDDKAVVSGNKITITFTSGVSDFPVLSQRLSLKSNRKYYIKITYEVSKLDQYNRALQVSLDSAYSASANYEVIDALNGYNNTKQTVSTICNGVDEKPYLIVRPRNYTNDVGETMSCEVEVRDITKMFNGVNEPATVEEFESLYGNMPDEYNKGTIIDNHTSAIKSVGVNAWDEEWEYGSIDSVSGNELDDPTHADGKIRSTNYVKVLPNTQYYCGKSGFMYWEYDNEYNYIPTNILSGLTPANGLFITSSNCRYIRFRVVDTKYRNDVCIHLYRTGYLNGKYFPYEDFVRELPNVEGGLKSAGSAYDEIRYNKKKDKWEHVKRIGSVDLGTLEWSIYNAEYLVYSAKLLDNGSEFNFLSPIYRPSKLGYSDMPNNTIRSVSEYLSFITVRNTAYTDVVTFKQAMQGVILYYELATPVVTELDVDISPDYKVWDYGTEEAISEALSTPVRINANYGFNAVGQITDNTELIKELLARVAVLEAQVAQANSANVEPIEPIVE